MTLLSISRANRFVRCARSYYYRYILNLPDAPGREALLGTFFHRILDVWAGKVKLGQDMKMALQEAYADKSLREAMKVEFNAEITPAELLQIREWLKAYSKQLFRERFKILGHEKEFDFQIKGNCLVRGAIDRIDELENGDIRIVDYKTGNSKYVTDKQLAVYAKALMDESFYRAKRLIGVYVFLKEDCRAEEIELDEKKIEEAVSFLEEVGQKIEAEQIWKPKPSRLCDWCRFKFKCAAETSGVEIDVF